MGTVFFVAEPSLFLFPYEYVSGVARLNQDQWGIEIYLVNRGGEDAMGRASVIEADNANFDGVFTNTERYNSGDQVVPPGHYGFSQFEPEGRLWPLLVPRRHDVKGPGAKRVVLSPVERGLGTGLSRSRRATSRYSRRRRYGIYRSLCPRRTASG